ncbi:MAG: ATP-grasp domain-containing protein [Prevotellaceae bacterium]|nr:ATP-grasp domain-containing protein [Candidatus Minthosoma equi]
MNKIIVFGSSHHNTLGLVRSIGENGIPVNLIIVAEDSFIEHSKYISEVYHIKTEEEVLPVLKNNYWNEQEKPIILCSSDAGICVLDSHFSELSNHFILFNINSKEGAISHFMNKDNTFKTAEECGIRTIKTWHLDDREHLPDDITYPCLVKHNNSVDGPKTDMIICNNLDELRAHLSSGKDYLIQEYIEKDYELNLIGVSLNHGDQIILPAAIRKIRDYLHFQSMYMYLESLNNYPTLNIEKIKSFISELGYEGLFSVELLCKDNIYYFLEVNLRNDGCCYIYTAAGANLPYMWIENVSGESSMSQKQIFCKTPFYLMNDYDIYNVRYGRIGFMRWFKDWLHSDAFFIYNTKDPRPFYYIIKSMIKKVPAKLFQKICSAC